jgi:hypothetical protein
MLSSVSATFEEHKTNDTWTTIPALVKAVDRLNAIIVEVAERLKDTAAPEGQSGPKAAKISSQADMVVLAQTIAAACHAYATDVADNDLAAVTDYSLTDLAKGSEATVVARCSKILELASGLVEELADYNITQARITALGKKIEAFGKVSPRPRQRVAKRAAANQAVPRLHSQARTLLTRCLDRLMVQFRATEPEFYIEYRTARKIVTQGGGKSADVVVPIAKAA